LGDFSGTEPRFKSPETFQNRKAPIPQVFSFESEVVSQHPIEWLPCEGLNFRATKRVLFF
jgi:hypothetical protein